MKKLQELLQREFAVSTIIIVLLGVIVGLRQTDMPDMANVMLVAGLLIAYAAFAVYVWQERPRDEREEMITLYSSKVAYLVGAAVLTIGTVIQMIQHELDVWLPVTLAAMVLSKAATLYRARKREE